MTIQQTRTRIGRKYYINSYSDEDRYIIDEFGNQYEDALDLLENPKEYTEGDLIGFPSEEE